MLKVIRENSLYLLILYFSILHLWYIHVCNKNILMKKYDKMTEEEKIIYDVSKVKMVQTLIIIWELILTVIAFIFDKIYPEVFYNNIFLISLMISLVVTVFTEKWILRVFCKKNV